MKNLSKTFAVITAIVLTFSVVSSTAGKKPRATKGNNQAGITYVVTVTNSYAIGVYDTYRVVILDEEGNNCVAPLMFYEGINNYVFHESGPVEGTRTARLEKIRSNGHYQSSQIFHVEPEEITGNFRDGTTYIFDLYVEMVPGLD